MHRHRRRPARVQVCPFVFGAMNLWWMAVIAIYCAAEKIAPKAETWGKYAGLAMIGGGLFMFATQFKGA